MGKKEYRVYEIMALLAEGITTKLATVRAERRAFMRYQKASAELERLRKRPTPKWTDHHAKVARIESQIAEREHEVDETRREKERATREAGPAEKNRADVQTQHDRELKNGGKVTWMEEQVKGTREGRDQVRRPSRY